MVLLYNKKMDQIAHADFLRLFTAEKRLLYFSYLLSTPMNVDLPNQDFDISSLCDSLSNIFLDVETMDCDDSVEMDVS